MVSTTCQTTRDIFIGIDVGLLRSFINTIELVELTVLASYVLHGTPAKLYALYSTYVYIAHELFVCT